jgi:hypothetical protein
MSITTPRIARAAVAAFALLSFTGSPGPLGAQQMAASGPSDSTAEAKAPKVARVFRAAEPFPMSIVADFKTIFKDRDSMSTKRYPATIRYPGENGDTVALDVQVSTRGHFRLKPTSCSFPPLKVHFDKEKTKGGPFGGEGALKLGTHCQTNPRYAQVTLLEYAANQMYGVVSPVSLKTRLASITWINPADPKFTVTRPGFWIQDEDEVAKHLGGTVVMQQGGTAADMNPKLMAITDVFQYMIGNTDFSLWALHNFRIIRTDSALTYIPMAYDFDWSGLVEAPYAVPDHRLPIRRVTDRLYRGACHPPDLLNEVLSMYRERKDAIYGTLQDLPGIDPKRQANATRFLDDFFKTISDPGAVKREFGRVC